MRKSLAGCLALVAMVAAGSARGADMPVKAPAGAECDPYKNYSCLDAYLGDGFWTRLINYYRLEWGKDSAPTDPKAPPSRRDGWPTTPQTTPPMPFTEWPYGGSTLLGVTRPNSVDSPLMAALGNTQLGKVMSDAHVQVYGWVNVGGNISTNDVKPGGNFPAAYMYTPDTIQLDQAVVYIERLPDTVQSDHIDWGFRFSALYGENYRYTTSYGVASYQLLGQNLVNGYDFPMVYGELFIPQIAPGGLLIRVGRFISLPDIEAQLAPNNYMYSHSLTYAYDNYTNEGIQTTWGVTKNLFLQVGLTVGTEAAIWHWNQTMPNPFPNPLYPNATMLKDPGATPSITTCVRYQTDSGDDNIYLCADAINSGIWGYNNLQWYGLTYYHKFNDQWHISIETYMLGENHVPNVNNPTVQNIIANGGTPFSNPFSGIVFNAPNGAQCANVNVLTCTATTFSAVAYLNYRATALDNISWRGEFFDDEEGQRTGVKSRYVEGTIGWQHWLSPQVELRPEVAYYRSLDAPAFDGNSNALPVPIPPTKYYAVIGSADIIWHF
ncbi:MAG TPA: outer membrane beta-barrel protein [Xanthobacteraceae bacterium]|nr:outer membrane beta-barrel protein [Xanthobacteraceae bacterium]